MSIQRNRDEARVVEKLLERVNAGEMVLVASFVVEAENRFSTDASRRGRVRALVGLAGEYAEREGVILERAKILSEAGLAGRDALHLASAERARVDCFITCDDKLLRRARRIESSIKVASPLELFEEGWIQCKPAI